MHCNDKGMKMLLLHELQMVWQGICNILKYFGLKLLTFTYISEINSASSLSILFFCNVFNSVIFM